MQWYVSHLFQYQKLTSYQIIITRRPTGQKKKQPTLAEKSDTEKSLFTDQIIPAVRLHLASKPNTFAELSGKEAREIYKDITGEDARVTQGGYTLVSLVF